MVNLTKFYLFFCKLKMNKSATFSSPIYPKQLNFARLRRLHLAYT
jgi:hypothetical protein